MDNKEEILEALDEFNRTPGDKVPPLLDRYLTRIAATGETLFAWSKLQQLFVHKLDLAMREFFEKVPTDDLPTCPNVENVTFEEMRQRLLKAVDEFTGAPFTIQRLCELITNPQKHYKRTDKFMRGIEKNLLVVSTVDPFGNKIVRETSKVMVNGLDANGYESDKLSPDTPERRFYPPPAPTSSPSNGEADPNQAAAVPGATTSASSETPSMSSWFPAGTSTDTVCPWGGGGPEGSTLTPGPQPEFGNKDTTPSSTEAFLTQDQQNSKESEVVSESPQQTEGNADSQQEKAEETMQISSPNISADSSACASSSDNTTSSSTEGNVGEEEEKPMAAESDKQNVETSTPACTPSSDSGITEIATEHGQISQASSQAESRDEESGHTEPDTSSSATNDILPSNEASSKENIADSDQPCDSTPRENGKRTIHQDHTETTQKRPRMDAEGSNESVEPSHVEESGISGAGDAAKPEDTVSESHMAVEDSEGASQEAASLQPTSEECEKHESASDETTPMEGETSEMGESGDSSEPGCRPAEVSEGRDSQDSLGFETSSTADLEPSNSSESIPPSTENADSSDEPSSTVSDSAAIDQSQETCCSEESKEMTSNSQVTSSEKTGHDQKDASSDSNQELESSESQTQQPESNDSSLPQADVSQN